jgi:hypothetical protein
MKSKCQVLEAVGPVKTRDAAAFVSEQVCQNNPAEHNPKIFQMNNITADKDNIGNSMKYTS